VRASHARTQRVYSASHAPWCIEIKSRSPDRKRQEAQMGGWEQNCPTAMHGQLPFVACSFQLWGRGSRNIKPLPGPRPPCLLRIFPSQAHLEDRGQGLVVLVGPNLVDCGPECLAGLHRVFRARRATHAVPLQQKPLGTPPFLQRASTLVMAFIGSARTCEKVCTIPSPPRSCQHARQQAKGSVLCHASAYRYAGYPTGALKPAVVLCANDWPHRPASRQGRSWWSPASMTVRVSLS
jgi:hypothetical protein